MIKNYARFIFTLFLVFFTWQGGGNVFAQIVNNDQDLSIISDVQNENEVQGEQDDSSRIVLPNFNRSIKSFNGSASTISGDKVHTNPANHLSNAMTGLLPGLITVQYNGNPGYDYAAMLIRGQRTFASEILVLINGQVGNMSHIQAADVESITILKDATALALYGMRAANGAILIQTKKGVEGALQIDFTAQVAYQQFTRSPNRVNSATFANMWNEALTNEGNTSDPSFYSPEAIQKYTDGSDPINYPDVNWYDDMMNDGVWTQKYNVNIRGGTKKTKYYVSLGVQTQSGIWNTGEEFSYSTNTEYSKYNFRSSIDFTPTKSTFVNVDIGLKLEQNNYPGGSAYQPTIFNALLETPTNAFPKYYQDNGISYDQDGNLIKGENGKIVAGSTNTNIKNPWAMINRSGYSISDRRFGVVSVSIKQKLDVITKGLYVDASISSDVESAQFVIRRKDYANYRLLPSGIYNRVNENTSMSNSSGGAGNSRNTAIDAALGYGRTFGRSDLSARLFFNTYESATDISLANRFMGGGGYLSYSYDNRYSADFTFAYQGSNKFAPGQRYAFTPAVAAGWLVSEEGFMQNVTFINNLKIRGSVGQLANHRAVGYYQYLDQMAQVGSMMTEGATGTISQMPGFDVEKVGDPNLTWEKSLQWNIGVDLGMFGNRLNISADYFQDYRRDMYLYSNTFSNLVGLSYTPTSNVGEMNSHGVEISLGWSDRIGDFHYSIGGNFTAYDNEITEYGEPLHEYDNMYVKGNALGSIYGLVANGFYADQADINSSTLPNFAAAVQPGDIKYVSQTGNSTIDQSFDKTNIGHGNIPKVFYAGNIHLEYKGISLNLLLQGAAKVTRAPYDSYRNTFVGTGSFFDFQLDRWTDASSVDAQYPRLSTETSPNNSVSSSFWVKDASYLRLKSAELGYTFNKRVTSKLRMQKLKIFLSGYNLLLIYDKIGFMDPESIGDGMNFPVPRIFNIGINLTF